MRGRERGVHDQTLSFRSPIVTRVPGSAVALSMDTGSSSGFIAFIARSSTGGSWSARPMSTGPPAGAGMNLENLVGGSR